MVNEDFDVHSDQHFGSSGNGLHKTIEYGFLITKNQNKKRGKEEGDRGKQTLPKYLSN